MRLPFPVRPHNLPACSFNLLLQLLADSTEQPAPLIIICCRKSDVATVILSFFRLSRENFSMNWSAVCASLVNTTRTPS